MGETQTVLFHQVISRLIESFTSNIKSVFTSYDEFCHDPGISKSQEEIFDDIFLNFPRKLPSYSSAIQILLKIIDCNPSLLLTDLSQIFLNHVKTKSSIFLLYFEDIYQDIQECHNGFYFNFSLIFLSDLISQVLVKYGSMNHSNLLITCAFNLCELTIHHRNVYSMVLGQWAVILSIISESNFQGIINQFDTHFNSPNPSSAIFLMKFLRLDLNPSCACDFLEKIVKIIQEIYNKKELNDSILISMCGLVKTALEKCNSPLNSLFEIAWSAKEDKNLRSSSYYLISSLSNKIPGLQTKIEDFYKKKVLGLTSNPSKVERSIISFFIHLSAINFDPKVMFWEWGIRNGEPPLSYIRWGKDKDHKLSELNVFMENFFRHSDFSICPNLFSRVLIFFASAEFDIFTNTILPKFLELDSNDNRFITLLMTIPFINSPDFSTFSSSEITKEKLERFNSALKPKILEAFHQIQIDDNVQAISISDKETVFDHFVEESDQYICDILKAWKLPNFDEVNIQHMKSETVSSFFALDIQLLKAIPFVFHLEELYSEQTMKMMLKLSFSVNQEIAHASFSICKKLIFNSKFVSVIIEYLMKPPSAEALFICITMLHDCLKKRPNFFSHILHDIELVAIIGLYSYHPATRKKSHSLLIAVNELLCQKGVFAYLHERVELIQKVVKQKIFLYTISDIPQRHGILPMNEIPVMTALCSHYFDIWKLFLSESANVIVTVNYTPLLKRVKTMLTQYIDHKSTILYSIIFSSYCSYELLSQISHPYSGTMFRALTVPNKELYSEHISDHISTHTNSNEINDHNETKKNENDFKLFITSTLKNISESSEPSLLFSVVLNSHVTLLPIFIEFLSTLPNEMISEATQTIAISIRHPSITPLFMRHLMPYILNYVAILQGFIISEKINGPRVIRWTPEMESNVLASKDLARNYCIIISQIFANSTVPINEDDWPLTTREIVFRFLINWSTTNSPELEGLREYAATALADIIYVGPLFSDTLLFDGSSIELLIRFENKGSNILSPLLFNHTEILLESYIEACYNLSRNDATLFFEAILTLFNGQRNSDIRNLSGSLLLLGLVYDRMKYQRAEVFLEGITKIILHKDSSVTYKNLHKTYPAITEAVIDSALQALSLKNLHVSPKDIIEAVKPWMSNLRLLPKQHNCVSGILSEFERFTPYQLLESLMEATEAVDEESFVSFSTLWAELMKCPDHSELVPLFICQWRNSHIKAKILLQLIKSDAPNIVKILAHHCSFAYYYHVTASLSKDFENELWVIPLITEAFKNENQELFQHIPSVIHFAFLFYDCGAKDLLNVLCQQFSISLPEIMDSTEMIIKVVREFVMKLRQNSEEYVEYWGAEALKWLFGCQSLKIAKISLAIFDQILTPKEPLVTTGICKAVAFHVINSANYTKGLTELVDHALFYYNASFVGNELFAFSFASSFLDCKIFVDSCLKNAAQLFLKSLSSPETNTRAWQVIIGIVRPLLAKLEKNEINQKILDLLIKTSQNQELMMIVAPIKILMPSLFPFSMDYIELMACASEAVLCKALVHYATMIETASTQLLNTIFQMATLIVQKIINENNRGSLAKIYIAAINNISNCEYAIEFVTIIAKNEPCVATKSVYEFMDWNRSLEDVCRSLGRIMVNDDTIVPLTDCGTLQSVYNLLTCDTIPKILPFAAQQEMIEGMMRVIKVLGKKRRLSVRRSSHGQRDSLILSKSNSQLNDQSELSWDYEPLDKPEQLFVNTNEFEADWKSEVSISPLEFAITNSYN
ncbi:hypothetical protein TRFO_12181 [Tritrichomonas foetus]|uniref:Uncharacterized protein n=1 Tax=Tritrichomonas foetus TaxID=1144522 RepID=A0A1J4J0Q2_9EUKA|nr:hypothetical protein TRFO_12181 [Tritrichomonas foetus]|eukprot:OHS92986.1 hypothetical protein TRFO_12181 [Tritrichomonas foetus]